MKAGKTLNELAAEITRQAATKKDYKAVADGEHVKMVVETRGVPQDSGVTRAVATPQLVMGDNVFGINEVGHAQIGEHVGIPKPYYDRMVAEEPTLLRDNVNRWLERKPEQRLVRTLDNRVRAFLSPGYSPLENLDLANAVLPVILELGLVIHSADITDKKLYIKAVHPNIERDVPTGKKIGEGHTFYDTISPAVIVSNSEVGYGQLSVDGGYYTKACTNMALIPGGAGFKRRHVGQKFNLGEGDRFEEFLTSDTKQKRDTAIFAALADVVRGSFEEARFDAFKNKLAGLSEQKIETTKVEKVIELGARHFGWTKDEQGSILQNLILGADLSRYGLLNAVTRAAEDQPSYDRASELERHGGQIIELANDQWQQIARAA